MVRDVVGLGIIAGVRSMSAPALLVRYAGQYPDRFKRPPTRWLLSGAAQRIIPFLALGEMLADKLPILPNRNSPGPLLGRIFWGGLVGGLLLHSRQQSATRGAVVGAASAALSTFVTYYI